MQKHQTSRLYRLDEITQDQLVFKLNATQRERVPRGARLHFHKCTQPYKDKDGIKYRHLLTRAEYYTVDAQTGKQRKFTAGSRLLGIIWPDDPEWVYATDKTKSSIAKVRQKASATALRPSRLTLRAMSTVFRTLIDFEENVVIVKKVPIPIFLAVTLICVFRGTSDTTAIANYWNNNIPFLSKLYPEYTFKEISHDSVTRIFTSLTQKCVKEMLNMSHRWARSFVTSNSAQCQFAIDGQACRSSCNYPDGKEARQGQVYEAVGRSMMILNAVDVTNGKLCAGHTMIDTKNTEPTFVPDLLDQFNITGSTVTFDALSTTVPVAEAVIQRGGFYLLAVKKNQKTLYQEVIKLIENIEKSEKVEISHEPENGHDRIDFRQYVVVPARGLPEPLLKKWPGLRDGCLVKAVTKSFHRINDRWGDSEDTRWFITCHPWGSEGLTEWLAECIRGHWGVESFHWVMDMVWRQDWMQCQHPNYLCTRETFAKMAYNILRCFQRIDQKERGLRNPRSMTQLTNEVGSSLEVGLRWLQKLAFCEDPTTVLP